MMINLNKSELDVLLKILICWDEDHNAPEFSKALMSLKEKTTKVSLLIPKKE